MKSEAAFPGALVVDSYPWSLGGTAAQAQALKASGVDALAGYLNAMTPDRLQMLFDAGLAYLAVTLANDALHPDRITKGAEALGLPDAPGGDIYQDIEGSIMSQMAPQALIDAMNLGGIAVRNLGLTPSVYFGSPQPLTSTEMFKPLVHQHYWKGIGSTRDRLGNLAEPGCGWCLIQAYHGIKGASGMMWKNTGVLVDPNIVSADYHGRVPNWFVGG